MKNFSVAGCLLFVFSYLPSIGSPLDSLDIKIGQMILVGFPGTEVDSAVLEAVRSGKAGSIILFEKNVPKTANAFAPLKKIIWTYQKVAPIPLLVSIDQEGGRVNRLKEKYGFPRSITADAMGKSKSLDSVRFYAQSIASNLAGLGINVNFAPDVDVAVNPTNPVIVKTGRSFSAQADSVTLLAREYIQAHRHFGIITVLKHFPGHGSSQEDTHYGVADVTKYWKDYELTPYQALLKSGDVDGIMSAHIVNRNLEPKGLPGTLSKRVLDSLLRKKMGYQGVVFSDDMHMHAISKNFGLEEAIKLGINAGIDILCFANNVPEADRVTVPQVHGIIKSLVSRGEISQGRINDSYQRIMTLKKRLNRNEVGYYKELAEAERKNSAEVRKKLAEAEAKLAQAEPDGKKKKKRKRSSN
jgi:beta-N-acetylhexosaminidase